MFCQAFIAAEFSRFLFMGLSALSCVFNKGLLYCKALFYQFAAFDCIWAVTSSRNSSDPVPLAAIHDLVLHVWQIMGYALDHKPFLSFYMHSKGSRAGQAFTPRLTWPYFSLVFPVVHILNPVYLQKNILGLPMCCDFLHQGKNLMIIHCSCLSGSSWPFGAADFDSAFLLSKNVPNSPKVCTVWYGACTRS